MHELNLTNGSKKQTKCIFFFTGSGRVTFNNQRSYLKAVSAAFVEIKTVKFTKKVSVARFAA